MDAETLLQLARQILESSGDTEVTEYHQIVKVDHTKVLNFSNPQDNRQAVFLENTANVAAEKLKESNLRSVKKALDNEHSPDETYMKFDLKKYRKQFRRFIW